MMYPARLQKLRLWARHTGHLLLGFGLMLGALSAGSAATPATSDYVATPPFVAQNAGKPNVIIALDISGSMKAVAYRDVSAGHWSSSSTVHDDFNPATSYFGYFDVAKQYTYDKNQGFFHASAGGEWSGNYLNWLTMRRIDVVRQVLVGGKVRDRAGELIGGKKWFVVEGQNEPEDRTFNKAYANSSLYSPIPDGEVVTIADGQIRRNTTAQSLVSKISDNMEVGKITMDWEAGQTEWKEVRFLNNYTNPIVVAAAISFQGSHPVLSRIKDVNSTVTGGKGFRVRLQEWEYLDGAHTTEDIIYIVAEKSNSGSITTVAMDDSKTLRFIAGKASVNTSNGDFKTVALGSSFASTPVVFAGVSSYNESDAVAIRTRNVGSASFEVSMNEQESNTPTNHASEDIHYIAVEPVTGKVTATGAQIEVGKTADAVTHSWYNINYSSAFNAEAMAALSMQTADGGDPSNPRFRNPTATGIQVHIDEEQSADSETGHTSEVVGYFATTGSGNLNIRLGIVDDGVGESEEPTGIVQDNSASMRIGLAVYNYDHTRNPTSIYTGNTVNGGTLYPCYPDTSKPPGERSNYDICKETHVKSPLQNIVDVIEDHPLIWGTTPIAETLYEIYGYVAQKNHNRSGRPYWYPNGTETDHPGMYPSYKVNNDWDPYYYAEYNNKLPCSKTFVLHFNDGAPYRDWDGSASLHPAEVGNSDGDGLVGNTEMLDDVAHFLRKTDCRTETGMDGHQEIITYYVYAALGEGEINNGSTRRMRESSANGGFVDADGDNLPDPDHPANFITYYKTFLDGGTCTPNEWDGNGDCNPDTFYLANDGAQLVTELNAAFQSIARRASTGGAASVVSSSSSGEGAIFQALFETAKTSGPYRVAWTGDVTGLFMDSAGYMREDDGDAVLEDYGVDKIVDMCYDEAEQQVRVKLSTTPESRPTEAQREACSVTVYTKGIFDLKHLWSAGTLLSKLTDAQVKVQRPYANTVGRHIITSIDDDNDGVVHGTHQKDFLPGSFTNSNAGLLLAADAAEAGKIVNYIRGEDQAGYRSRAINATDTWRLGDIIYSTPTPVSRPSEAYDILYNDASYSDFLKKYKDRRLMIYAGANDGMLHAFNGGWYDVINKRYFKAPPGKTAYALGAELWSYVPYNLLPHLKYLTDTNYGRTVGNHVYYVDLKPRIFDAKIFPDDATHPNGWGTVLVGGMRLGGGHMNVDIDPGVAEDKRDFMSAFFILDITDPEQPPKLLLEFTHPKLGFTTAVPAPFVVNGKWYLMLGSGPGAPRPQKTGISSSVSDDPGHLFLVNLHTMNLESGFGTSGVLQFAVDRTHASDLAVIDYDLDYSADSIYFGTVHRNLSAYSGDLWRLQIENNDGTFKPVGSWAPTKLFAANQPITARPALTVDRTGNRWVAFGTGLFYVREQALDTSTQTFYAIKEPRDTAGDFTWGTASLGNMANVSNAVVEADSGRLSGVTLSPPLPSPANFSDLQARLAQYSTNYLDGWYRNLSPNGNRVVGEATLFGATVTFTSYAPDGAACSYGGNAELYSLYFGSGTASPHGILGRTTTKGPGGGDILKEKVDLGDSLATTPSQHTGSGYDDKDDSKAVVQGAAGDIQTIEQNNSRPVRSGESSWRELK